MVLVRRTLGTNWKGLVAVFVGVLAPLVLFGTLAEDVWLREGISWDERILRAVHAQATPLLDGLMLFFTHIGAPLPMTIFVALILLLLLVRGQRADVLFLAAAIGGATALNVIAKLLFQRARPTLWISAVHETNYSFPSGHAMGSMAVVAALLILLWHTPWRWAMLAIGVFFVAAVGLSRVYLGVHYPSDIFAGWCAALAWVTGVRLLWAAPWLRSGRRSENNEATFRPEVSGGERFGRGRPR